MKRIICNTKLKKIFIALLIFILLSYFIFPNVVIGVVTWKGNNATGSIQEVADSMRTLSSGADNGSNQKTIADMIGVNTTDKLKTEVINQIKSKFPTLEEGWPEKVYNYYRDSQDMIEVTCSIGGSSTIGHFISGFTVNFGETLTIEKIKEDLGDKTDEEIGEVDDDTQVDTAPDSGAAGQDPDGGPTVEIDEDATHADLGGILLSPVFYLINFVADAVISVVTEVMTGEGTFLGLGVLCEKPGSLTKLEYADTFKEKRVDTTDFIPTNLLGLHQGGSILYQYPNLPYTPEAIFSGTVNLLSIDFFSNEPASGKADQQYRSWDNIRKVISQWYSILRMIAIIALLSVLIYTGIKIILSANAKDKAKYKEWIMDWFMAVAILFSMHIIMAFTIAVTNEFSELISNAFQGIRVVPEDNAANAFNTNLMGYVRFMIQSENFYTKVGFEVMYIALIWYTIKFTFTYLKRVLNMAFLTLIAPIVAVTYPIDKINDGRAQGFDMWLKEYIFNALLQPMHAILYYILVGCAIDIASSNPLYGIVVLAFMAEAEKLLKKIFGFDKASGGTVGGMASAFAAGAIASNLTKMMKLPKGNAGKGGAEGDNNLLNNLKPAETDTTDESLFDFTNGGNLPPPSNPPANPPSNPPANPPSNPLTNPPANPPSNPLTNPPSNSPTNPPTNPQSNSSTQKERMAKFGKGMKNVGKRLAKPVWDFNHGAKYNGKRLLKKAGRAYLGASLGIGAAAVQAGISITDGKYNPMEGMAALAAGYAGGGQIASGIGSLYDTYQEGTLPDDPKDRNKKLIERAQDEWSEREDVIKYNKKYKPEDRDEILRIQKDFLEQGITDPKEMDSCIKYLKNSNNGSLKGIDKKMVQKSRAVTDFYNKDLKNVGMQKAVRDLGERKKYIQGATAHITDATERAKQERILENKFNETAKYLDAQK